MVWHFCCVILLEKKRSTIRQNQSTLYLLIKYIFQGYFLLKKHPANYVLMKPYEINIHMRITFLKTSTTQNNLTISSNSIIILIFTTFTSKALATINFWLVFSFILIFLTFHYDYKTVVRHIVTDSKCVELLQTDSWAEWQLINDF